MSVAPVTPIDTSADWLSTEDAVQYVRLSRRKLGRLVESGALHRRRDARGRWEYSREALDRILERPAETDAADLMDVARSLIATMEAPMRFYNDHIRIELSAMRDRCSQLERVQTELITARESALSQAFDREVLALKTEGEESRKSLALQQGAALVGAITQELRAARFMQSITVEQLELLTTVGSAMLTPEQLQALQQFKEARVAAERQAAEKPSVDVGGVEVDAEVTANG